MENYFWKTEEEHINNTITMSEYLVIQESFTYHQHLTIEWVRGTVASGLGYKGDRWQLNAFCDGDRFNHKIIVTKLKTL